jgi:hypothetical protein
MRSLISLVFLSSLVGCASAPKMEPAFQEKFKSEFSTSNLAIANKYYRNFQQYEGLSQTYWETILDSLSSDTALGFKKDMRNFDITKVRGFEKGVVVCVYSSYFEIGFCDNTRCDGVEISGITSEKDINEAMAKTLAYICSK